MKVWHVFNHWCGMGSSFRFYIVEKEDENEASGLQ